MRESAIALFLELGELLAGAFVQPVDHVAGQNANFGVRADTRSNDTVIALNDDVGVPSAVTALRCGSRRHRFERKRCFECRMELHGHLDQPGVVSCVARRTCSSCTSRTVRSVWSAITCTSL